MKRVPFFCVFIMLLPGCGMERKKEGEPGAAGVESEVIYHVVQRSFYDSNGDFHGDLDGLRERLDYLQELGVTTILMLPLYESVFYHNYFAGDFEKIDPEFGAMEDFLELVKEVHRRGMKIYLDMETQYVTEDHPWYKGSYGKPDSEFGDYILYKDAGNTEPETIVFGVSELESYDGTVRKLAMVNLYHEAVQAYNRALFRYWMDPDGGGNFEDGADGFRLDHMMDDLDHKGRLTDLFRRFWTPLLDSLREVNPAIKIVAEQADWGSYGREYLEKGKVDRVFAFPLMGAILSFDKARLSAVADSTFAQTPAGKEQVVFIENHDLPRFSSAVEQDPGKMRVGAALNLLLGGIPAIYYGQELGMRGEGGFGAFGSSDGNDIPRREAFEWYRSGEGRGMALWYKDTGPWWDQTNIKADDGISLEEQKEDPESLWNFYRNLLELRREYPALAVGSYRELKNDNGQVFSFLRQHEQEKIVVTVNLSDMDQEAVVELEGNPAWVGEEGGVEGITVYGKGESNLSGASLSVALPAYGTLITELR